MIDHEFVLRHIIILGVIFLFFASMLAALYGYAFVRVRRDGDASRSRRIAIQLIWNLVVLLVIFVVSTHGLWRFLN